MCAGHLHTDGIRVAPHALYVIFNLRSNSPMCQVAPSLVVHIIHASHGCRRNTYFLRVHAPFSTPSTLNKQFPTVYEGKPNGGDSPGGGVWVHDTLPLQCSIVWPPCSVQGANRAVMADWGWTHPAHETLKPTSTLCEVVAQGRWQCPP